MGIQLPPKVARTAPLPPQFRRMSIVTKRLDGLRCHLIRRTEVGFGPDDILLDGAQLPQRGRGPQFLAHVYCGQTVAHLNYC